VVVGVCWSLAGDLTIGGVVAYAFLVSLFVGPITTGPP
jgi:hypothetical protein